MAFLPTRQELDELFEQRRETLLALIRSVGHYRDAAVCEDILHNLYVEIRERIDKGKLFVNESLEQYVPWLISRRVIDDKRRRKEMALLQKAIVEHGGELPAATPAARPSTVVSERERAARKQKLLSEILEEYCHHCESQPRMLKGKEVFERTLRGQSPDEIAAAMKMNIASVYKHQSDARARLERLLEKHDAARSVFQTVFRRLADRALQGRKKNQKPAGDQAHGHTTTELFRWLIEEAGALCPLPERLEGYAARPHAPQFSDVSYHVEEACCPLCSAWIAAARTGGGGDQA